MTTRAQSPLEWRRSISLDNENRSKLALTDPRQTEVSLCDKVRFLRRPGSYPDRPATIEAVESHMSWVFLTERHAYKLKKPVRYSYLDYSTIPARRDNCAAEVRLNRRFAPDVYLGIMPLTADPAGRLQLAGAGAICDWLVKMVRLPAERTLEAQIARRQVDESELRQAVHVLTRVYRQAAPAAIAPAAYRRRFHNDLCENLAELSRPVFGLSSDLPQMIAAAQRRFMSSHGGLLDARVEEGRIVEAHGDLRPEHIYLGASPIIMDCIEFNREFRLLDPADELAYLAIECHRLGAPRLGDVALDTYRADTGDRPPVRLVDFYASARAMLRAKLAIWHLQDDQRTDAGKWRARAKAYLEIAAGHAARLN